MHSCGFRSVEHTMSDVCSTLAAVAALAEFLRLPWLGRQSTGRARWGPKLPTAMHRRCRMHSHALSKDQGFEGRTRRGPTEAS